MKMYFTSAVLYFVFALSGILLVPVPTIAVDVDQNVTLQLPSDGSTYTLWQQSGSFDSLTVNNDNFSFDLTSVSSVEIISLDNKKLTNSVNIPYECQEDGTSYVKLSLGVSSPDTTVTVTPSGTCGGSGGGGSPGSSAGGSSSSGGGGGGGGGSLYAQTSPPSRTSPVVAVAPSTPAPAPVVSTTAVNLTRGLTIGSTGADVTQLQEFLATDPGVYPEGLVTGYFGLLSERAVQRFQEKYGIAGPGDAGYGYVGPKTRAKIAEVSSGSATQTPAPAPVVSTTAVNLTRGLTIGSTGADVTQLQEFLATDPGVYPEGLVTGYFGPLSERAVQRFQEKYGIAGPGDAGYGYVGPKTRAKIAEVSSGSATQTPTSVPTPISSETPSAAQQADIQALMDQIEALQNMIDSLKK